MNAFMRFLSVLAVATFFAACGLPDNPIDNTAVVQVANTPPISDQTTINNPVVSPLGNPSGGIGTLSQALDSTGLGLKMPLRAVQGPRPPSFHQCPKVILGSAGIV